MPWSWIQTRCEFQDHSPSSHGYICLECLERGTLYLHKENQDIKETILIFSKIVGILPLAPLGEQQMGRWQYNTGLD